MTLEMSSGMLVPLLGDSYGQKAALQEGQHQVNTINKRGEQKAATC